MIQNLDNSWKVSLRRYSHTLHRSKSTCLQTSALSLSFGDLVDGGTTSWTTQRAASFGWKTLMLLSFSTKSESSLLLLSLATKWSRFTGTYATAHFGDAPIDSLWYLWIKLGCIMNTFQSSGRLWTMLWRKSRTSLFMRLEVRAQYYMWRWVCC